MPDSGPAHLQGLSSVQAAALFSSVLGNVQEM